MPLQNDNHSAKRNSGNGDKHWDVETDRPRNFIDQPSALGFELAETIDDHEVGTGFDQGVDARGSLSQVARAGAG